MKLIILALALISGAASASSFDVSTRPVREVDATKLCKAYYQKDPEAVTVFNELLAAGTGDVVGACAELKASGKLDQPGPEAVAISLMSQFYEVSPDAVQITVHHKSSTAANVIATAPGGHMCVFSMSPAPPEALAPYGWVVGSTACQAAG